MAVTCTPFNAFLLKQFNGNAIDLDTNEIKVALFTAATPPVATWDFYDDVAAGMTEVSGAGYTAGGAIIADIASSGTTTVYFDATDTAWTEATITNARYAVVYCNSGSAATSKLLYWIDFGENKSVASGTFTIIWNATDKMIKITAS